MIQDVPIIARRLAVMLLIILVAAGFEPARAAEEPANAPAELRELPDGRIELVYHGGKILTASFHRPGSQSLLPLSELQVVGSVTGDSALTQRLSIAPIGKGGLVMDGVVTTSDQAFAAETASEAQSRLPLVRNSAGPSRNLRNNAVYDRQWDWVLEAPPDRTRILPQGELPDGRRFSLTATGDSIELYFRPRFYQRHKGIRYFRPWEYRVKETSVTGWCSWWAYMGGFNEQDLDKLLGVWKEQRMADYGLEFIQIDDTFQRSKGLPDQWLEWNSKFPSGMAGYVSKVRAAGGRPGIWIAVSFEDQATAERRPEWFVRNAAGQPHRAQWIGYPVDATVPGVADHIVRPLYRGLKQAGFPYVKIDGLRHLLYDGLRSVPGYAAGKNTTSDDIYRAYLRLAREELGPETFVLGCWGVIPESVGLVDSDRLGGDGFGPATLQQYNSWNGVVWRNDPDHCDVRPSLVNNQPRHWFTLWNRIIKPKKLSAPPAESIIRPTVVSMAGAVLLISDRAEVYRDPLNLEGARRASPVLFTLPGQLYDFEPSRTDALRALDPATLTNGGPPTIIDAHQFGQVAEWWLLEIDRPFEHWTVAARLNFDRTPLPATAVSFADLGLEPDRDYLVYEFWTKKFLGVRRGAFTSAALGRDGAQVFALRELLPRPQLLSTSRHISQGAAEILEMKWEETGRVLSGRSRVVAGDRYELVVHAPEGFAVKSAEFGGAPARIEVEEGGIIRLAFFPAATGETAWRINF